MEFRVCRQPFNEGAFNRFDHVFGINPTFGSCHPRCYQSRRHQPIHVRVAMNQLIEEARRQVEIEQSSGAISDYFAAMDSILNAFNSQKNSVKRTENDDEEAKSELEKQDQRHTTLDDIFEAAFKELTKDKSEESNPEGEENNELEKPSKNPNTKQECQTKEEQLIQVTTNPTSLSTKAQVSEDLEKLEIEIEFSGYQFKPEHLDVQLVNENVLVISAKDGEYNFERKFKLASNCKMDKIMPKFKDDENKQILSITVPKEVKKIHNIPISTSEN